MSQELKETAYHEAGHAVLMRHFDYRVDRVEVFWNKEDQRWNGKTHREIPKAPTLELQNGLGFSIDHSIPLIETTIALAGCFSQTKYLARLKHADAMFATEQSWDQLFNWMRNMNPERKRAAGPLGWWWRMIGRGLLAGAGGFSGYWDLRRWARRVRVFWARC
jgi:hypothetical protein